MTKVPNFDHVASIIVNMLASVGETSNNGLDDGSVNTLSESSIIHLRSVSSWLLLMVRLSFLLNQL